MNLIEQAGKLARDAVWEQNLDKLALAVELS